jgi:hypothetical protein
MAGPAMGQAEVGFEYPWGWPDRLRAAGHTWAAVADKLDGKARTLNAASQSALALDWSGKASLAYADYSLQLSNQFVTGATVCREASLACTRFAHALEHAQNQADQAEIDALDALQAQYDAKADLTAANAKVTDAAREQATLDAATAAAAALSGAPAAVAHAALAPKHTAAAARASSAAGERSQAQGRVQRAHDKLLDAQRRGRAAKRHADDAAQRAARVFELAAGVVTDPPKLGHAPIPVTVRPHRPGEHGLSPSDIRIKQIDAEKKHGGDRYPWLFPALDKLGLAQGTTSSLGKAAETGAVILDAGRDRDDLLRNGPSAASAGLRRIANNPFLREMGRARIAVPAGFAFGMASAIEEGRKPLDAAGKSLIETLAGGIAGAALAVGCASVVVDGPVGAGICVVGGLAGGTAGGMGGGAVYDLISPPPKKKKP